MSAVQRFENFLTTLDPDRERAGELYRALHDRLVKFFEWQGVANSDERADEVLDRVLQRIAAGERIVHPKAYALGVARLLLREVRKENERDQEGRTQLLWLCARETHQPDGDDRVDRRHCCLEKALAALDPDSRTIILTYYSGEGREKIERRRQLAAWNGTDVNALRVRAHRIRVELEMRVARCLATVESGK